MELFAAIYDFRNILVELEDGFLSSKIDKKFHVGLPHFSFE